MIFFCLYYFFKKKKKELVNGSKFRSSDPGVMGPMRSLCANPLFDEICYNIFAIHILFYELLFFYSLADKTKKNY